MTKATKTYWEKTSKHYQDLCKIPIDVHYGPGSPNEQDLKLLGKVRGKNILEIGCGGAQCSIAFAKQGAKVTGIDISEEQLTFARALAEKNKVKITLYQGDVRNLKQVKSKSQDIVFSAFALQYVDNIGKCFREVFRVLRPGGTFVFSLGHPFSEIMNAKTLKVKSSYFKSGKLTQKYGDLTFVMYYRTVGELFGALVESGFVVDKLLEPDSRKKYSYDPWRGFWDYTPKMMKTVPQTIIFRAKKRMNY